MSLFWGPFTCFCDEYFRATGHLIIRSVGVHRKGLVLRAGDSSPVPRVGTGRIRTKTQVEIPETHSFRCLRVDSRATVLL